MLTEYGTDGFENSDAATRTRVRVALHDLMAETLREQDVIVCTLATTAKVNLAQNFNPVVTFLDDAGRAPEAKSIMIPAMYPNAQIHFLVGDHQQMKPFCSSFGRERYPEPFLNPFALQLMLSGFERLIRNGAEHTLLNLERSQTSCPRPSTTVNSRQLLATRETSSRSMPFAISLPRYSALKSLRTAT